MDFTDASLLSAAIMLALGTMKVVYKLLDALVAKFKKVEPSISNAIVLDKMVDQLATMNTSQQAITQELKHVADTQQHVTERLADSQERMSERLLVVDTKVDNIQDSVRDLRRKIAV